MLILVSGGAGSGKSEFAEGLVTSSGLDERVYLATMKVWDAESVRRVERHRQMRAGKGFETLECPENLAGLTLPSGCAALLEDLSNLTANEFFGEQGRQGAFDRVLAGIDRTAGQAGLLISVFVFSGIFLAIPSGVIIAKLGYYKTGIVALAAILAG